MYGTWYDKDGYHLDGKCFADRNGAIIFLTKEYLPNNPFTEAEANEELDYIEQEYNDPNSIIAQFRRDGVENIRIFAQMRRFSQIVPMMGIALCDADDTNWVECRIDEERYPLHGGYKITLKPIEPYNLCYASDHYYQCDFESGYRDGWFILKTDENQHVEHVRWFDEIPGTAARVVHDGYVVV